MKFRFDEVDERFQGDLHALLEREVPDWYTGIFVLSGEDHEEAWDWANGFSRSLAQRGMLVPGWPSEYGGQGRSGALYARVLGDRETGQGRSSGA